MQNKLIFEMCADKTRLFNNIFLSNFIQPIKYFKQNHKNEEDIIGTSFFFVYLYMFVHTIYP